jgi:hypothetical protein
MASDNLIAADEGAATSIDIATDISPAAGIDATGIFRIACHDESPLLMETKSSR